MTEEYAIEMELNTLADMMAKKNSDYGSAAFDSPLLVALTPSTAVLVRLSDKIKRLEHLARNSALVGETFEDTLRDLAGYCVLYLAIKRTEEDHA